MKIYTSASGYIDLEAPIHMTEEKHQRFIEFFDELFPGEIEVVDREETKGNPPGGGEGAKRWELEEFAALMGPQSNEELAEQLGRSKMSIMMHRGQFVPNFRAWLDSKGLSMEIDLDLISEFLSEGG